MYLGNRRCGVHGQRWETGRVCLVSGWDHISRHLQVPCTNSLELWPGTNTNTVNPHFIQSVSSSAVQLCRSAPITETDVRWSSGIIARYVIANRPLFPTHGTEISRCDKVMEDDGIGKLLLFPFKPWKSDTVGLRLTFAAYADKLCWHFKVINMLMVIPQHHCFPFRFQIKPQKVGLKHGLWQSALTNSTFFFYIL